MASDGKVVEVNPYQPSAAAPFKPRTPPKLEDSGDPLTKIMDAWCRFCLAGVVVIILFAVVLYLATEISARLPT